MGLLGQITLAVDEASNAFVQKARVAMNWLGLGQSEANTPKAVAVNGSNFTPNPPPQAPYCPPTPPNQSYAADMAVEDGKRVLAKHVTKHAGGRSGSYGTDSLLGGLNFALTPPDFSLGQKLPNPLQLPKLKLNLGFLPADAWAGNFNNFQLKFDGLKLPNTSFPFSASDTALVQNTAPSPVPLTPLSGPLPSPSSIREVAGGREAPPLVVKQATPLSTENDGTGTRVAEAHAGNSSPVQSPLASEGPAVVAGNVLQPTASVVPPSEQTASDTATPTGGNGEQLSAMLFYGEAPPAASRVGSEFTGSPSASTTAVQSGLRTEGGDDDSQTEAKNTGVIGQGANAERGSTRIAFAAGSHPTTGEDLPGREMARNLASRGLRGHTNGSPHSIAPGTLPAGAPTAVSADPSSNVLAAAGSAGAAGGTKIASTTEQERRPATSNRDSGLFGGDPDERVGAVDSNPSGDNGHGQHDQSQAGTLVGLMTEETRKPGRPDSGSESVPEPNPNAFIPPFDVAV